MQAEFVVFVKEMNFFSFMLAYTHTGCMHYGGFANRKKAPSGLADRGQTHACTRLLCLHQCSFSQAQFSTNSHDIYGQSFLYGNVTNTVVLKIF